MKIKDFEKLFVNLEANLREGISTIEKGQLKIALVVNEKKELIGLLSDGDVRRSLLNNISLNDPISKVMQSNFIYLRDSPDISKIYYLMESKSILHLPIISKIIMFWNSLFINHWSLTKENLFQIRLF